MAIHIQRHLVHPVYKKLECIQHLPIKCQNIMFVNMNVLRWAHQTPVDSSTSLLAQMPWWNSIDHKPNQNKTKIQVWWFEWDCPLPQYAWSSFSGIMGRISFKRPCQAQSCSFPLSFSFLKIRKQGSQQSPQQNACLPPCSPSRWSWTNPLKP